MGKEMTDDEIREMVRKRWLAAGCIGSVNFQIEKEIQNNRFNKLRKYAKKLRTEQNIPNERGPLT